MRPIAVLAAVAVALSLAASGCGPEHDESEPKREGLAFKLDGLDYNVFITRQLNIRNAEDHDYYPGPDAPRDRACTESSSRSATRTPTARRQSAREFKIVDTQKNAFEPKELPKSNFFAYHPAKLSPQECIPTIGGAAATGPTAGSMLLFELPTEATENRPLELEVEGPFDPTTGKRETAKVELDI